jgi:L-lactate dehydrogenase complex protein LldG
MSSPRQAFLQRVRAALAEGNQAPGAPELPARGSTGYQGAEDLVARFCQEFTNAGGQAHVVGDALSAVPLVRDLATRYGARRILLGEGIYLEPLHLGQALVGEGREIHLVQELAARAREEFFHADLGISGVDYLIAETGSLVLGSRLGQPRSLSLLPPVHLALAHREQILPDLFDLFEGPSALSPEGLPSNLALITGPSKTGDIELRLVTGVHGPGEIHVVLIDPQSSPQAPS